MWRLQHKVLSPCRVKRLDAPFVWSPVIAHPPLHYTGHKVYNIISSSRQAQSLEEIAPVRDAPWAPSTPGCSTPASPVSRDEHNWALLNARLQSMQFVSEHADMDFEGSSQRPELSRSVQGCFSRACRTHRSKDLTLLAPVCVWTSSPARNATINLPVIC